MKYSICTLVIVIAISLALLLTDTVYYNPVRSKIGLFIVVPVSPGHFYSRMGIRRTWMKTCKDVQEKLSCQAYFLVGMRELSNETARNIVHEAKLHRDLILLDNLGESYRNLTEKALAALRLFITRMDKPDFFLKVDSDVHLKLPILFKHILNVDANAAVIWGDIGLHGHPKRSQILDKIKKRTLSKEEFTDKFFPPFVKGPAYLMTRVAAACLYDGSKHMKRLMPLEDVFITGIVRRRFCPSIKLRKFSGFFTHCHDLKPNQRKSKLFCFSLLQDRLLRAKNFLFPI